MLTSVDAAHSQWRAVDAQQALARTHSPHPSPARLDVDDTAALVAQLQQQGVQAGCLRRSKRIRLQPSMERRFYVSEQDAAIFLIRLVLHPRTDRLLGVPHDWTAGWGRVQLKPDRAVERSHDFPSAQCRRVSIDGSSSSLQSDLHVKLHTSAAIVGDFADIVVESR